MEASAVLEQAAAAGLTLRAEGGKLLVKGDLTDELRSLLRSNKDAILQALRQPAAPAPEPWDAWAPAHAGNVLVAALAEVEARSLEQGLLPTEPSRARCLDLMEQVDAAEGDMAGWTAAVAAWRAAALEGLTVAEDPKATAARRVEVGLRRAFWLRVAAGGLAAVAEGREQGVAG